jgi:hypothetical protein
MEKINKNNSIPNIPSQYNIAGCTISIDFTDILENGTVSGIYNNHTKTIKIAKKVPDDDVIIDAAISYMEQTFWHEVVHSILYTMGIQQSKDGIHNEEFVENFSVLLHQIYNSIVYNNS